MDIFLVGRDFEHLFMYLLTIDVYHLRRNVYLGALPIFNWVICFFVVALYWSCILGSNPVSEMICKCLFAFCRLPFYSVVSFDAQKFFVCFRFCYPCVCCHPRNHWIIPVQCREVFSLCFPLGVV